MVQTQLSVLGCGWLGLPLAKALLAKGFAVKGSTTTVGKTDVLQQAGINPFIIDLTNYSPAVATEFVKGSEVVVINIPPKLRSGGSENYPAKINMIVPQIIEAGTKKVLFVSSTSVYADDNGIVTESTPPNPDTESGRQVLQAEQLLQANTDFRTTIIRFGGLIGEDRQPVRYLSGKENLSNPDGPVNLIHFDDCIGIILKIIEKDVWGETFNAAHPLHPTRNVYYTQKAIDLGLPLPVFSHALPSVGKTIDSHKIADILGYEFKIEI